MRRYIQKFGSFFALILLLAVLTVISPYFLTVTNIFSVLRQGVALALVAIGMTYAIVSGGIDLSVGSVMALSGCLSGILMVNGTNWLLACLLALVIGGACGLFAGYFIAVFKLQPFIVTLVVMTVARGLALVFTNGIPVAGFPEVYRFLGTGTVLGFPFPVLVAVLMFSVFAFILKRTRLGVNIYAIGGNLEAAHYSGINIKKMLILVYTFSGLLSGLAGIIMTSRLNSGQPILGEGIELDAIASVVIGGTAMSGGQGGLGGTVIGVLIIIFLHNGLNLLGVSAFWQKVAIGIVILLAVLLDHIRQRIRPAAIQQGSEKSDTNVITSGRAS